MTDRSEGGTTERRGQDRVEVPARVELRFSSFSTFVSQYVANVSTGGMFIVTREPMPAGTPIEFRLALADGFPLIEGSAEVVWIRRPDQSLEGPPGMAVRFLRLEPDSKELIARMVDQRRQSGEGVFQVGERREPIVAKDGDPFQLEENPREAVTPVAFDVFPAPPAEEEEAMPGGADAFQVSRFEDDPVGGFPVGGRRSPVLFVVTVAVLVVAGVLAYLGLRSPRSPAAVTPAPPAAEPSAERGATAGKRVSPPALRERPAAAPAGTAIPKGGQGPVPKAGEGQPVAEAGARKAVEGVEATAPAGVGTGPTAVTQAAPGSGGIPSRSQVPLTRGEVVTGRTGAPSMARRLKDVHIGRMNRATRVELRLDGRPAGTQVRSFAMNAPPRFVVQLRGVTAEDPYAVIPAHTVELRRVRLGYHEESRPPYLQIVLDLQDGSVRVRPRVEGASLVLHVARAGR